MKYSEAYQKTIILIGIIKIFIFVHILLVLLIAVTKDQDLLKTEAIEWTAAHLNHLLLFHQQVILQNLLVLLDVEKNGNAILLLEHIVHRYHPKKSNANIDPVENATDMLVSRILTEPQSLLVINHCVKM